MTSFCEILLDGESILPMVRSLRLDRRNDQAVDELTLELASYALYDELDFSTLPAAPRIQVATAVGDAKTDGAAAGNALTSASSNFVLGGVTVDDLLLVLASANVADVGAWPITSVAPGELESAHAFAAESGVVFIVLKSQGRFFIEKPDVLEDRNSVSIPSLWGRSGLARLLDPFAAKLSKTWNQPTTFYEICGELVSGAGMDAASIVFDIDDYPIPASLLSVTGQYPLQVIIDLASKTNGYVRNSKRGDLWVKRERFHFGALPVAQPLVDDDVQETRVRVEYPEFGNRILVQSSMSRAKQQYRISFSLQTGCIRADGFANTAGEAVVTDGEGNAVPDGVAVEFTIDNPALATWFPEIALTGPRGISGEVATASDASTVSTKYPIRQVMGVYPEADQERAVNYFFGGAFEQQKITLGEELPFSDSRVLIDYVAAGIATATLLSVAGAPEEKTFVHAAIGKIRETQEFCINNQRNVSISLHASKTEFNLCEGEQTMIAEIVAQVMIDGNPGNGAMLQWILGGDAGGSLTPKYSSIKNTALTENTTAQNNFSVHVQNKIASVVGVWLQPQKTGTDYYNSAMDRKPSFDESTITLGTNLPASNAPVIVEYVAYAAVRAQYTGPTQVGKATITAQIPDGTTTPAMDSIEIDAVKDCSGGLGGGDTAGNPGGKKDCDKSMASAQTCSHSGYPNIIDATQTDCICRQETGEACPQTEAECKSMCEGLVARYGLNPLDCDVVPTAADVHDAEQRLGTIISTPQAPAYVSCIKECNGDPDCVAECVSNYPAATVDRCAQKCLNHGLTLSPRTGTMNCGGAKSVTFKASGGKPPYTWSSSKGTLETTGDKNESAILRPPANSGSGVVGDAYRTGKWHRCGSGFNAMDTISYGCNDQVTVGCVKSLANGPRYDPTNCFFDADGGGCEFASCPGTTPEDDLSAQYPSGSDCLANRPCDADGTLCDKRTPSMISDGCNPCRLSMSGNLTVTVKDSAGQAASAVVTAKN